MVILRVGLEKMVFDREVKVVVDFMYPPFEEKITSYL
jgi:hypothetical protein